MEGREMKCPLCQKDVDKLCYEGAPSHYYGGFDTPIYTCSNMEIDKIAVVECPSKTIKKIEHPECFKKLPDHRAKND